MIGTIRVKIDPIKKDGDQASTQHNADVQLFRYGAGSSDASTSSQQAILSFKAIFITRGRDRDESEIHNLGTLEGGIELLAPDGTPMLNVSSVDDFKANSDFNVPTALDSNANDSKHTDKPKNGCSVQTLVLSLNSKNFSGVLKNITFSLPASVCGYYYLELSAKLEVAGKVESPEENNDVLDVSLAQCKLTIQSEAELTFPSNRARTRIAVTEKIVLTAKDAYGIVTWAIISGHGTLSATGGESITYTAHDEHETVTIEARDQGGCKAQVIFTVDCNYLITQSKLAEIFTTASTDRLDQMTLAFNQSYTHFSLDTCLRRAHFFAQVLTEVGTEASPNEESMNYDPTGLKRVFRYFRDHPLEADQFGRVPGVHPADQEAIANRAYADRGGNGDIASGDGWRYRGRGYIQLTFRDNYQNVQTEIDSQFPTSGINIVNNFTDIVSTRGGLISAMGYWSSNNLYTLADAGATDAAVDSITDVVNLNDVHRQNRKNHFNNTTKVVFKVTACSLNP